ncbi:DUF3373 family protein [Bdellovibrio sp. KM01]|uniref:DUF3373 family protein n=1 Tax=Bdellovibrio sp. KM01 TaxID=2748865 RepID=UPI0015EA58A1|nr:DUF3373 family protein [Bdellovibrio sp. KM01]QLY25898.1 DUF3373 family protein [Bdellovibrio sp. KM01]
MKNNFKKISAAFIAGMLMVPTAQAATLEERVAELEANQSLNIFSFSGTFNTRFDDILSAKQTQPATVLGQPATFDTKDLTYLRMKFQFNIDANVSKNVKFYSRLTTSKHFNTFYQQSYAAPAVGADLGSSNDYSSTNVVLEKAYVDMTMPDTGLTFFIGRLPTVDGQPQNYKDGRARMGTYPMLSYDSVLDGMGLSYKLDQYMPQGHQLALRALYTPFAQYYAGTSGGYYTQPSKQAGGSLPTSQAGYGLMVDYGLNDMSWADNMGLVLLNFQTADLYYPAPSSAGSSSSLTLAVGGTTLAWELNGIAKTGWDLSASYLASSLKSNGRYISSTPGTGFGTSKDEDTSTGGVMLLSTRYRLGSWIIGGEWVNGSENSFYYATAAEDLTQFYSTHGNGYHLYFTKKFGQNIAARVGYMLQDYDYTPTSVGAVVESDRKIETAYANLRLDF